MSASSTYAPRTLVTCIMPTANRRQFVPGSIRMFLEQDYDRKELIVIDDGVRGGKR